MPNMSKSDFEIDQVMFLFDRQIEETIAKVTEYHRKVEEAIASIRDSSHHAVHQAIARLPRRAKKEKKSKGKGKARPSSLGRGNASNADFYGGDFDGPLPGPSGVHLHRAAAPALVAPQAVRPPTFHFIPPPARPAEPTQDPRDALNTHIPSVPEAAASTSSTFLPPLRASYTQNPYAHRDDDGLYDSYPAAHNRTTDSDSFEYETLPAGHEYQSPTFTPSSPPASLAPGHDVFGPAVANPISVGEAYHDERSESAFRAQSGRYIPESASRAGYRNWRGLYDAGYGNAAQREDAAGADESHYDRGGRYQHEHGHPHADHGRHYQPGPSAPSRHTQPGPSFPRRDTQPGPSAPSKGPSRKSSRRPDFSSLAKLMNDMPSSPTTEDEEDEDYSGTDTDSTSECDSDSDGEEDVGFPEEDEDEGEDGDEDEGKDEVENEGEVEDPDEDEDEDADDGDDAVQNGVAAPVLVDQEQGQASSDESSPSALPHHQAGPSHTIPLLPSASTAARLPGAPSPSPSLLEGPSQTLPPPSASIAVRVAGKKRALSESESDEVDAELAAAGQTLSTSTSAQDETPERPTQRRRFSSGTVDEEEENSTPEADSIPVQFRRKISHMRSSQSQSQSQPGSPSRSPPTETQPRSQAQIEEELLARNVPPRPPHPALPPMPLISARRATPAPAPAPASMPEPSPIAPPVLVPAQSPPAHGRGRGRGRGAAAPTIGIAATRPRRNLNNVVRYRF